MKLFEIKGLEDGVKFEHICFSDKYVYYDKGIFLNDKGNCVEMSNQLLLFSDSFELYKEPKKKKRFWIWTVKDYESWVKSYHYLDDKGEDNTGSLQFDNWFDDEKIKHEDEYIDIEVDWED